MIRVAGITGDLPGFPHTPSGIDVLERGKLISHNVTSGSHNPLQCFAIAGSAVSIPGSYATSENTLNCAGVKCSEDFGAHPKLLQAPKKKEALVCLLQHCNCVNIPCEVLSDVDPQELEAVYPLHRCPVDGDRAVFFVLFPKIHYQFLGFFNVE